MNLPRFLLQSALVCLLQVAEAPSSLAEEPATEKIRKHVEFLASPKLKGRGDEETKKLAQDYLIREYSELKLEPLFEGSFLQIIPGSKDKDEDSIPVLGNNLGALRKGTDPELAKEWIIVSAHYDHLGKRGRRIYAGADDNAASVAMTLEIARTLPPTKRSVAFVNFDLEESLLMGSRWFVAHPPCPLENIKFMMTADLIGRKMGDLPLDAVFVMGSETSGKLVEIVGESKPEDPLRIMKLGIDLIGTRSDYGPFQSEKVPFLFFSTGQSPDYHTHRDVPDKIEYEQVRRITLLIKQIVEKVGNSEQTVAWDPQPPPALEEAKTLHRISELVLEANKKKPLTATQKFVVDQVFHRTSGILDRGQVTDSERVWIVRMAQAMLLTVFTSDP